MKKDASLVPHPSATKKNWHHGPQLTILAQDHIHGGANVNNREATGTTGGFPHKIINNTGPGGVIGVFTGTYNTALDVS